MSVQHEHGRPDPRDVAQSVDPFIASLRPELRRGFLSLRALLMSLGSDVAESSGPDEVTYERRKPFLVAKSVRARLHVVFPDGADLDDPLGRLLRKGGERYVRIEGEDLDPHFAEFVKKAYAAAR